MDINEYIEALSILEISDDKEIVLYFDMNTISLEELGNIVERIRKELNRSVLAIPYDMCLNTLSVEVLELWVDMVNSIISEKKNAIRKLVKRTD
jgi:hypothetical protein